MCQGTLVNACRRLTRKKRNYWIKSLFLFSMLTKSSIIILRLNHWCHMDYFNEVLTTFLGLERCSCVAVYAFSASVMVVRKVKKKQKTVWPIHTSSIAVHFRDLVWLHLHQKQTVPEFAWIIPKTTLFRLVYGSQVRTCLQKTMFTLSKQTELGHQSNLGVHQ